MIQRASSRRRPLALAALAAALMSVQPPARGADQSQWVYSVRFSPDGKQVLSGGANRKVQLWGVANGGELRSFTHPGWQQDVSFSPDGLRALSGVRGWNMRLWDLAASTQLREFNHGAQVNAALFLPDGKTCLSIGRWPAQPDAGIRVWDAETGRMLRKFVLPEDRPDWGDGHGWASLDGEGKTLLTCSGNVGILWSVETGTVLRTLAGHTALVWTCAITKDGTIAATGGMDNTIRVWRVADGSVLKISRLTCEVRSLVFSRDGKLLAAGAKDGKVRLYTAPAFEPTRRFDAHKFIVESLDFSPDGSQLVSGGFDSAIHIWDTKTGRRIRTLTGG